MIVLVVGTFESGGDSLARILHEKGISMVEEDLLAKGDPFENPRFRHLNDRIAERRGYRIDSYRPEIPVCKPGAITRLRMRRVLRGYGSRHQRWGFYDPRTSLTLDAWLREIDRIGILASTRIVFAVRDPDAVAASMKLRIGIDAVTALRLWKTYTERALTALDAWDRPTHYVSYEDLCRSPASTTISLCRFVGSKSDGSRSGLSLPETARGGRGDLRALAETSLAESVLRTQEQLRGRVRSSRIRAPRPEGVFS